MKKALLCVSFGTSVESGRKNITAVENILREEAGDCLFVTAFTSPTIRSILAKRGEKVYSVPEALDELLARGVTHVAVQPTHLLYGREYDRIREMIAGYQDKFDSLILGRPLLADTSDIRNLAERLSGQYPAEEGRAIVFIGHGTDHAYNAVYPAMQTAFHLTGREDAMVGTVEGWPAFEDVEKQLKKGGFRSVLLVPMLLVAGDHALNDIAGDEEDSWKSMLTAKGYQVECVLTGLGLLEPVQQMYLAHFRSIGEE